MIGELSWVQLAWPMMAAACLVLAYLHLGLWLRLRDQWAHLMLAGAAISVAVIAGFELAFMNATSPEQANGVLRWVQLPTFLLALSFAGFARFYFGSARTWLVALALVPRLLVLGLAFLLPTGLYYRQVGTLEQVVLPGGARISVLVGVVGPWTLFSLVTWLLLPALVADSAHQAWRRSPPAERPRIVWIGTAIVAFLVLSAFHSFLVRTGTLQWPYLVTPTFCLVVLVLASDLTANVARASQLAEGLRASEARLRESETDRELAINAASLALWSLEAPTSELQGSRRFRELFGLDSDPPYRLAMIFERVHPEDQKRVRAEIEAAISERRPIQTELRVRSLLGGWHWLQCVGRFDDLPGPSGPRLRGVCFDVTELRLAEERFRKVVESVPTALLIVDAGGRITFANRHAVEVFGYSIEELANLELERLLPAPFRERHLRHRSGFTARPQPRPMGIGLELFGLRKDGTEFPIEVSLAPLPAEADGPVVAMIADITVRRQQELDSARQRAELTHLSRVAVLGELSASLAHELNQPLAAILVNAQAAQRFLDKTPVDLDEVREIVGDIVADDKRAGEVIRRLRAMLRKEELPRVRLETNELVRGVIRIMHGDLVNRGVAVVSELEEGLPMIDGDPVQLQQVLLNLILNAADSMELMPRPRMLSLRTSGVAGEVWTEVSDRGSGIPEPDLERIFEPFVTSKPLGTGLGLSVCRTIISSHNGRIWARNNPEGGSTLTVALPAASPRSA